MKLIEKFKDKRMKRKELNAIYKQITSYKYFLSLLDKMKGLRNYREIRNNIIIIKKKIELEIDILCNKFIDIIWGD